MDDWGVVQQFMLEADTFTSLKAACAIMLTDHTKVVAYAIDPGTTKLTLLWHKEETEDAAVLMPFELATSDDVADFIWKWLQRSAAYPRQPNTDGSVKKGFRITHAFSYVVLHVEPVWIVYGK